jgi:hypothetical protein
MSMLKVKAMVIVFFDIRDVIMNEWVPQGQTVNQKYYLELLTKLRERVRKKRPGILEASRPAMANWRPAGRNRPAA